MQKPVAMAPFALASSNLLSFHALELDPPSFSRSRTSMTPVLRLRHRVSSLAAAAVRQEAAAWIQAPLSRILPASSDSSLFHVTIDVSDCPDVASSHTAAGQYLRLRLPSANEAKPAFLAIASPPSVASARGEFEFLVKRVAGSTAELLCYLKSGDAVEISGVMGRGFDIARISPPNSAQTVLVFATGSGISSIRSLIETGFNANERPDVRLYYGARNIHRMAYQDRFKNWESMGIKIVPVLSQPDDTWKGEKGYVQAVFSKAKRLLDVSSTAAVLCGHKAMTEEVTSLLVADGVSHDKILNNF